jgi:hypothetical protein
MVPLVARSEAAHSALALAPERWSAHPGFPQQTLLLGSHRNFRRISAVLNERAEQGFDTGGLRRLFWSWKSAMRGHEHYEEGKLYPYLERRWGLSFDDAVAGHRALSNAEMEVFAELQAPGPAGPTLVAVLAAHHELLIEHLALEEARVIPALLALTPAEFEDYTMSDIRGLLQRLS